MFFFTFFCLRLLFPFFEHFLVLFWRESAVLRNDPSRVRGWILENTKIDPVFNIHADLCFKTEPASWVRIVNGVEKYVNETTETIEDEECFWETYFQNKTSNTEHTSPFLHAEESGWTSIREVMIIGAVMSKSMIRLLRHDQNVGKPTEQSTMKILMKNSTKRKRPLNDWISVLA